MPVATACGQNCALVRYSPMRCNVAPGGDNASGPAHRNIKTQASHKPATSNA
jgi:hypothetical protein